MYMEHEMKSCSARGHGSWKECVNCGMAKHSGFYWLAGYKSEEIPPCTDSGDHDFMLWANQAIKII